MSINRRQFTTLCAQSIGFTMLAACQMLPPPPRPNGQAPANTQVAGNANPQPTSAPLTQATASNANVSAYSFAAFSTVTTRQDATNLYIESNGIPSHPMMIVV